MGTIDAADRGLALPALTTRLAAGGLAMRGDGFCEFEAQVKIPAHALVVWTVEAEQGLGEREVEAAFKFTVRYRFIGGEERPE